MTKTPRPRVLLVNARGEVLLLRSVTGLQKWDLPGGGMERNETPEQAVRREANEEVGIALSADALTYIGTTHRGGYEAPVYMATVAGDATRRNRWEISGLRWVSLDKLPIDIAPTARWACEKYKKHE